MICAIYARKSTEQNGIADEAKSVTRQIEHARVYATRRGWTAAAEHVYADDGISGAEFATRPGFLRLMNALKPAPPFQVLVMSEESRLGREQIETAYALKQLVTAGVRVFFYLEDRERTLDSPTDKLMLSVTAFADEMEREKARQRTTDAMVRKARAGHVTGGRVFGYDNREVLADEAGPDGRRRRLHVERVVNPAEAAVVGRIFELCAAGRGFKRIAATLNHERARAPPPRAAGRVCPWAASTVRDVVHRELYRGVVVWNRTKKRNQWGLKTYTPRAESEWLRLEQPALRIVEETLWRAAHERLEGTRGAYLRGTRGRLWGRPASGLESRYLLTGFLACGVCGGSLVVTSRDMKTRRKFAYACSYNRFRGTAVCSNGLWAPMEAADREILDALERDLLRPEIVEAAFAEALEALRPSRDASEQRRATLEAEQRRLDGELGRLTEALVAGGDMASLVAAMKTREQRRGDLADELATLTRVRQMGEPALAGLHADLRARLADWQGLLRRQPAQGRQILRKLLVGRLVFTPRVTATERYYEYSGDATLGRLLAGAFGAKTMVTPAGFEPAISTLKGSRPGPD